MTQEDKELLLKDLCARLPYGVKIDKEWIAPLSGSPEHCIKEFDTVDIDIIKSSIDNEGVAQERDGKMTGFFVCSDGRLHTIYGYMCKPYLRPMSSMTEKEKRYVYNHFGWRYDEGYFNLQIDGWDYLYSNHIDVRGLIEKGLALEAPEGMYKTE